MSDKLVVEFYGSKESTIPVACVVASYGGDNPSSGATTLSDFFDSISALAEPRFYDASVLAARFVVWQAIQESGQNPLECFSVFLIPFETVYGYQTVRVYADADRPYVHCVNDEWTTPQELMEAALILRQADVGPVEVAVLG